MREHYLRDDICCGVEICKVCDTKDARLDSASAILVVDTNVVLRQVFYSVVFPLLVFSSNIFISFRCVVQIDLLENPALENVVVLDVVMEEVKNKNLAVYNRLKALCTSSQRKFFVFYNEYHK